MRHLERLRLAHEPRARALPVALGVAAQQPDRDRVAERAMGAAIDDAVEPAAADSLAEIVGRQQAALRRRRCESTVVDPPSPASSACPKSAIVDQRSSGSLASARLTAMSTHAGMSARVSETLGTGALRCAVNIAIASGPPNGTRPVSISKTTAPRL